jgi:hypothetical protein
MKALVLAVATAVLTISANVAIALAGSLASSPPPTVSRVCHAGDDLASVIRVTVNDRTDVDLWCGDRVMVAGNRCLVQRGANLTEVPCTLTGR